MTANDAETGGVDAEEDPGGAVEWRECYKVLVHVYMANPHVFSELKFNKIIKIT